jgi:inositol-phosphate phosphatase / L-galactose 1-phosphate phosphatase / histidinol-phosphatase
MMDAVLSVAMDIQREAAETALKYFRQGITTDLKSDKSPVTAADLAIERNARTRIEAAFPDHEILGEEFGAGDLTKNNIWVIDPIDGTRSFISGHPAFGFLLAYLEGGVNRLSIVGMPALNELFIGQAGQNATLNGSAIKSSGETALSDSIMYINEGEKLFAKEPAVHAALVNSGHTRRFAYDCYPHAMMAAGYIDCVVDYDLKPFDYLPLAGLIQAAGGIITDWHGNKLDFNSDGRVVSAATPELHSELLAILSMQGFPL